MKEEKKIGQKLLSVPGQLKIRAVFHRYSVKKCFRLIHLNERRQHN